MNRQKILKMFWSDVVNQNKIALRKYFDKDAIVRWNNTNEQFTVEEYIVANCEYPGDWQGEVERIVLVEDIAITVTRVWQLSNSVSFHVTSFFEFKEDKILSISEYWGDDGNPPQWRIDKNIGSPIR